MKRTKPLEKTLYYFINNTEDTHNFIVNEMLKFWEFYDVLFRTNHYQILKVLASPVSKRYTAEGIALLLNISDRTLLRYRKLYIKSYLAMCKQMDADSCALAQ